MTHPTKPEVDERYVEEIRNAGRLISEWVRSRPTPPVLRWHDRGETMYIGGIGTKQEQQYLANSPDAFVLLDWLDAQTDHRLTLFQVDCALRVMGVFEPAVERYASPALTAFRNLASGRGEISLPSFACGHCKQEQNRMTPIEGEVPSPGSLILCASCTGINVLGEDDRLSPLGEQELSELPPDVRSMLEESRDLLRASRLPKSKETVQS